MKSRILILAGVSIILAIALWVGYVFLILALTSEREAYALLISAAEVQEQRDRAASRLRAVARDTRDDRERLEELLRTDAIQAAATIEALGKKSGTQLVIEGATSQGSEIATVYVTLGADGTLPALSALIRNLENLPFPSSVDAVSLESRPAPDKKGAERWHLTARVKIMTTATNNL